MDRIKLYMPLIITLGVAVYMGLKPLLGEETFDATDVSQLVVAAMTAGIVFLTRNVDLPGSQKLKTVFTFIGTIAGALTVMFVGGLDADEFFDLGVLALGLLGVSVGPQPAPVLVQAPPTPVTDAAGEPKPPAV